MLLFKSKWKELSSLTLFSPNESLKFILLELPEKLEKEIKLLLPLLASVFGIVVGLNIFLYNFALLEANQKSFLVPSPIITLPKISVNFSPIS